MKQENAFALELNWITHSSGKRVLLVLKELALSSSSAPLFDLSISESSSVLVLTYKTRDQRSSPQSSPQTHELDKGTPDTVLDCGGTAEWAVRMRQVRPPF
jgi:hypothetical protein